MGAIRINDRGHPLSSSPSHDWASGLGISAPTSGATGHHAWPGDFTGIMVLWVSPCSSSGALSPRLDDKLLLLPLEHSTQAASRSGLVWIIAAPAHRRLLDMLGTLIRTVRKPRNLLRKELLYSLYPDETTEAQRHPNGRCGWMCGSRPGPHGSPPRVAACPTTHPVVGATRRGGSLFPE